MVKERKTKAKSPPLLAAMGRRSDVSGPKTPASDERVDSFDLTPVKTSPELARQVENLDLLLANQEMGLDESINTSFESNDDLESELKQLAQSEALLRQELELFQGGAFFSDVEEEQQEGYEYIFSEQDIDSPQASGPSKRPAAPKSATQNRKLSLPDDEESVEEMSSMSESSAQTHPVRHSAKPAGASSSETPRIQETQFRTEIFRDSPPQSSPNVSDRKRPPISTPSPDSHISTPSPRRLDPLLYSGGPSFMSTPSPIREGDDDPSFMSAPSPLREEADYSIEVGDSLDSLFYSPTPAQRQSRGELSPPYLHQKRASPPQRESHEELETPLPRPYTPRPQAQSQSDGALFSKESHGSPYGVSILAKTPSRSEPRPPSRSERSISSKESEETPTEVSILTAGAWGAPSQLEDVQQETGTAELDMVVPPEIYRRQSAAAELDLLLHMDGAESSDEGSGIPLIGQTVESREVGIHPGADEYADTIPTDYSNVSSVMSFSQDSTPGAEPQFGELDLVDTQAQFGEPVLVDPNDEYHREGLGQAAFGVTPDRTIEELPNRVIGDLDEMMGDQESPETTGSDVGGNIRRKCAAVLFVMILVSSVVLVPIYFAIWRNGSTSPLGTVTPTEAPSRSPTVMPSSRAPDSTLLPSAVRTASPATTGSTDFPSGQLPAAFPSVPPSRGLSFAPSQVTLRPTRIPSARRTADPTVAPPTVVPTGSPSEEPVGLALSQAPVSPTFTPSDARTASPTSGPTILLSMSPSTSPISVPTTSPSEIFTAAPSQVPASPTFTPSVGPTASPISSPTQIPTSSPFILPTADPSLAPTAVPSAGPTLVPTQSPVSDPTIAPSLAPIAGPSAGPTLVPTVSPVSDPTIAPSLAPTAGPTAGPTLVPTLNPVSDPTIAPSVKITLQPTFSVEQRLFAFLESVALDGGANLRNPLSPQFAAFEWLAGNANLAFYSADRIIQRHVLATFYYSTRGELWLTSTDWISDEDECTWYTRASSPCGDSGDFQRLELYYNNVQGSIPPDLALLSNSFQCIDISGGPRRAITGTLPAELGLLTGLQDLRLQNNSLTGIIPSGYGAWASLEWLDLSSNRLTATLPSEIGQWVSIETLNVAQNQLQGTIPTQIGTIRRAIRLTLDNNNFVLIPTELGLLTDLQSMSASNNNLTMSIPSEIGLLTSLQFLSLDGNQLGGTLFTEIGNLTNLRALSVASNSLRGPIPSELGALMMLRDRLDLSDNQFTGQIPVELGRINNRLRRLFIQNNLLSGSVPSEIAGLTKLSLLRLESNQLTGEMPSEVCNVFNMTRPSVFIDCEEVFCPCCNFCCKEGEECVCRYLGTTLDYLCFF